MLHMPVMGTRQLNRLLDVLLSDAGKAAFNSCRYRMKMTAEGKPID